MQCTYIHDVPKQWSCFQRGFTCITFTLFLLRHLHFMPCKSLWSFKYRCALLYLYYKFNTCIYMRVGCDLDNNCLYKWILFAVFIPFALFHRWFCQWNRESKFFLDLQHVCMYACVCGWFNWSAGYIRTKCHERLKHKKDGFKNALS